MSMICPCFVLFLPYSSPRHYTPPWAPSQLVFVLLCFVLCGFGVVGNLPCACIVAQAEVKRMLLHRSSLLASSTLTPPARTVQSRCATRCLFVGFYCVGCGACVCVCVFVSLSLSPSLFWKLVVFVCFCWRLTRAAVLCCACCLSLLGRQAALPQIMPSGLRPRSSCPLPRRSVSLGCVCVCRDRHAYACAFVAGCMLACWWMLGGG